MEPEVARYESATGWVEFTARDPAPALRPHVEAYWAFEERSAVPVRRIEVPYPSVIVVLEFDGAHRFEAVGDVSRTVELSSFVAGLGETAARTEHDGAVRGIEFSLSPLAARMLFGVPMHHLAGTATGFADVFGRGAATLVEQLHDAPGPAPRFELLDRVLATRLAAAARPPRELVWAWHRLRQTDGAVAIQTLVSETGWTRKRLAAAFRDHVGMTPKAYARILRFGRAVRLVRDERRDWPRLAAECGYYDQAHFNRDFREFAGMTPTEFTARLSPDDPGVADTNVQDTLAAAR